MLVRKEKRIYLKGETTFYFSNVTLLSLVHLESILFDAASGLLVSPRNDSEGIRYSGREKTQKMV